MKKILALFLFILAAIFAFFTLTTLKGDYNAERRLWHINKEFSDMARSPESIPDQAYSKIAEDYKKFIEDFSESSLRPRAGILLGRVYMLKEEYEIARAEFAKIADEFPEDESLKAEISSLIAKTYELEGNWLEAKKIYKKIQKDRPLSNVALSVPLYIAQYHKSQGELGEAQDAFAEAVTYYSRLIGEYPNSELEVKALRLLSVCYLAQGNWMESIRIIEKLLLKYPAPFLVNQATAAINNISVLQLQNYDIPIKIYTNFIERNPEHPLNGALRKMIATFERLKNEKILFDTDKSDNPSK